MASQANELEIHEQILIHQYDNRKTEEQIDPSNIMVKTRS